MIKYLISLLLLTFLIGSCTSAPTSPTQPKPATTPPTIIPSETPLPTQTSTPTAISTIIPTVTNLSSPTNTPTDFPYPTKIIDNNDVEMALVPAGKFIMGDNNGQKDEKPAHTVFLDAFYIDVYEVTNAKYKDCVVAEACQPPIYHGSNSHSSYYENPQFDNYPVIYVNWDMAKTYCQWRDAELPTEAQWEKAARGTDGRTYPWGEEAPNCYKANFWSLTSGICVGDTIAVGNYESGKSPYGVYDMAGNVWEWVADWYSETYYQDSPSSNPPGPIIGEHHMSRGGAWLGDFYFLRVSGRHASLDKYPNGYTDVGIRCSHTPP